MQGSGSRGRMLRKESRWQIMTPTYGYGRKRNDRAYEKRNWKKEADAVQSDAATP